MSDKVIEGDPFGYDYVGHSIVNILDISSQYPDYFPLNEATMSVANFLGKHSEHLHKIPADKFDYLLRSHVLTHVKNLCAKCDKCELSKNRDITKGRGSVFGEGRVDATVMIVAEG